MMTPFCRTQNGVELQFGTNYIGHVLLTYLLIDKLRTSGTRTNCARIINISSHVHYAGKLGNLYDTINRQVIAPQRRHRVQICICICKVHMQSYDA